MSLFKSICASVVAVALLSGMCLGSVIEYKLDNGAGTDLISWSNSDTLALNVFQVDPSANIIDRVSLAWGNLPAGTPARVILYSMDDGTILPGWGPVTMFHVLQVIDTTVAAGQSNELTSTPVWTTYSLTPTAITTTRFAVGTIAANPDANTVGTMLLDKVSNLAGPNISFIGCNSPISSDLHQLGVGNSNDVGGFSSYGYGNNPFLIRAEGVPAPEPATMALLTLGGLATLLRRRRS